MPYLRYLMAALSGTIVILLAVAGFNAAVDPYGLFGFSIHGVNAKKPETGTHILLGKQQRLIRAQPETVILGNSRADLGLNAESPYWPEEFGRIFNFAIPGTAMYGTVHRYDFARRHTAVRRFVLPLDLMDFLAEQEPEPSLNFLIQTQRRLLTFRTITETLLSKTAFLDSILTILGQRNPYAADVTPFGFNPAQEFIPVIRLEGHHAVEAQKLHANFQKFVTLNAGLWRPDGTEAKPLRWLRLLLEDARKQTFDVTILFYPVHANLLDVYDVTNRWTALEDLKRVVVDIVSEQQAINPAWQAVIWDFADYSKYTTEPFPPPGNSMTQMQWYWESGHFKSALGELMLQRMYHDGPEDFGARLTSENIDSVLTEIRQRKLTYRSAFPETFEMLRAQCLDEACETLQ